jgi:hypothetical protein
MKGHMFRALYRKFLLRMFDVEALRTSSASKVSRLRPAPHAPCSRANRSR